MQCICDVARELEEQRLCRSKFVATMFGSRFDPVEFADVIKRIGRLENQQGNVAPRVGSLEHHIKALDQKTKEVDSMMLKQQRRLNMVLDEERPWVLDDPSPMPTASAPALADLTPPAPPGIGAAVAAPRPTHEEQAAENPFGRPPVQSLKGLAEHRQAHSRPAPRIS